jgi:hypothetical protein
LACTLRSTQSRLHTCNQFARLKWLANIVVCAQFQTRHTVDHIAPGCEHNDWNIAGLANLTTDFETVFAWQHDVEQQQVRLFPRQLLEALD